MDKSTTQGTRIVVAAGWGQEIRDRSHEWGEKNLPCSLAEQDSIDECLRV
jgi:hypothetical protein